MCQAMQDWVAEERLEGKAEGKAEDILELLKDYGTVSALLREKIMKQTDLQLLSNWLRIAIHVKTVEEFEKNME